VNLNWRHDATGMPPGECRDFPQRREFAADDAVREHLGGVVPDAALRSWEIVNVWYFPHRTFEVVYRLFSERGTQTVLTVRFLVQGRSGDAFASARFAAADPAAVVHLESWNAVGWLFPEDPKLPTLRSLLDPGRVSRTVGIGARRDLDPARFEVTILSYLPGERFAGRYLWDGEDQDVVGKLQENAAAGHTRLLQLWDSASREFGMPQPLTADTALGARWETFARGKRIEAIISGQGLEAAISWLLPHLVSLHAQQLDGLARQDPTHALGRITRKVLPRVVGTLPRTAGSAESLVRELTLRMEKLPPRGDVTLHGDLHTANVLFDGNRVNFIDLDSLATGNPAFDLAVFGTRLLLVAMLDDGAPATSVGRIVESLPASYRAAGGAPVPDEVYAWYLAALLFGRQAKTCVRHHAPRMEFIVPRLIRMATQTLARGCFQASLLER